MGISFSRAPTPPTISEDQQRLENTERNEHFIKTLTEKLAEKDEIHKKIITEKDETLKKTIAEKDEIKKIITEKDARINELERQLTQRPA